MTWIPTDDLAQLLEHLNLNEVVLVGFSAGGGEVARYIGRHGSKRVAKAVLVAAVTPFMLKTTGNPLGIPIANYNESRAQTTADRSQLYKDIASGPFYGANRADARVSQGVMDRFWLQGVTAGHKNTFDCIKAFSETDFSKDLEKFTFPTLIIHGDDDQIVPIELSALRTARTIRNSTLKIYEGGPHGLTDTHKDQLNTDLLAFLMAD